MADSPKVNVEFINPFITSTVNSFKSMIMTEAHRKSLYIKKPDQTKMAGDVSVLMSVFGGLQGSIILTFPRKVSIALVAKMLMDDSVDDFNDDVLDGIGEIGNLIVGGAKSEIAGKYGMESTISIPTTVTGSGHHLEHYGNVPVIGCVFSTDCGNFAIEVAVSEGK